MVVANGVELLCTGMGVAGRSTQMRTRFDISPMLAELEEGKIIFLKSKCDTYIVFFFKTDKEF